MIFLRKPLICQCFSHRCFIDVHDFSCFFEARFRDRFLIAFWIEKATKMTSKIDRQGDPLDQKGSKILVPRMTGSVLELTFFRASISVACGNSSAPGPREDSLHAKICKKFNTRVNAGVFFYKFLP